jgi:hypothetical protein
MAPSLHWRTPVGWALAHRVCDSRLKWQRLFWWAETHPTPHPVLSHGAIVALANTRRVGLGPPRMRQPVEMAAPVFGGLKPTLCRTLRSAMAPSLHWRTPVGWASAHRVCDSRLKWPRLFWWAEAHPTPHPALSHGAIVVLTNTCRVGLGPPSPTLWLATGQLCCAVVAGPVGGQ